MHPGNQVAFMKHLLLHLRLVSKCQRGLGYAEVRDPYSALPPSLPSKGTFLAAGLALLQSDIANSQQVKLADSIDPIDSPKVALADISRCLNC